MTDFPTLSYTSTSETPTLKTEEGTFFGKSRPCIGHYREYPLPLWGCKSEVMKILGCFLIYPHHLFLADDL